MRRLTVSLFALALLGGATYTEARSLWRASPAPSFDTRALDTGVRLRYVEQGPADGPVVVLLHGFSDSWFSWSRVLPLLPPDLHVLAPDLRGHGASGRPARGYGAADMAADVAALLDSLRVSRATVVGHSMGTWVAQQLALTAPARVEALVLVGGSADPTAVSGLDALQDAIAALADPVPESFVRDFQQSTVVGPVPVDFMDGVVAQSLLMPTWVWQETARAFTGLARADALSSQPPRTLLIWGDADGLFPRSAQDGLLQLLPGARLLTYRGTGHGVHWEQPERFARDLTAFLDGS